TTIASLGRGLNFPGMLAGSKSFWWVETAKAVITAQPTSCHGVRRCRSRMALLPVRGDGRLQLRIGGDLELVEVDEALVAEEPVGDGAVLEGHDGPGRLLLFLLP